MLKKSLTSKVFALAAARIIILGITLFLTASLDAQEVKNQESTAPFNLTEAHQAVKAYAKQLEDNFIYPDIGKKYANMLLSKISNGDYSKFITAEEFAATVTRDLQAVYPEGHLKLQPPTGKVAGKTDVSNSPHTNGVGKYGWLSSKVAYFDYLGFSGDRKDYDEVLIRLRKVLDEFSTAKTLIIDVRSHPGGGLDDVDLMFSYFFDKPVTLVMMDTRLEVEQRSGSPLANHPTLRIISSPEGIVRREHFVKPLEKKTSLSKARIFLLTSNKTASAGEHLVLALKRTKRATVIGETTAGAGHFGRTVALGGGYRAFIPVGRTFDPDTDKGWELTGIEPDVKVSADKALDEAISRTGINPKKAKKALDSFTTK